MTTISVHPHLEPATAVQVRALATAAADADGVAALSEASRLALGPDSPHGTHHVLAHDGEHLIGYAQVWPDASAELVVDPGARRRGAGTALWAAAREAGAERVWAHGDLPPARAFAAARDLAPTRSLLKMSRPLDGADRIPRELPAGFAATTFADRPDVEALQRVNAAAFASHPEQSRLTVADLRTRMEQPWFDPEGLIWVLDEGAAADADPAAFHWTKIDTPAATTSQSRSYGGDGDDGTGGELVGEVYVVGVHPDYQGRGLAGPLTDLGLAHLVRRGCTAVELYVDGDNTPARATYERAGLTVSMVDQVYAPLASSP
ncbi:MAG TPA: mycothiol synthase [Intrasporangiaceae bacterium]|nr:mycothiol synthase [Intrasporangiaceae bacterium]